MDSAVDYLDVPSVAEALAEPDDVGDFVRDYSRQSKEAYERTWRWTHTPPRG